MRGSRERNPDWMYNEDIGGLSCPGITLTVRGVEEVTLPDGKEKLGLRFRYRRPTSTPARRISENKLLVLNVVNTEAMRDIHGGVPEEWVGCRVGALRHTGHRPRLWPGNPHPGRGGDRRVPCVQDAPTAARLGILETDDRRPCRETDTCQTDTTDSQISSGSETRWTSRDNPPLPERSRGSRRR